MREEKNTMLKNDVRRQNMCDEQMITYPRIRRTFGNEITSGLKCGFPEPPPFYPSGKGPQDDTKRSLSADDQNPPQARPVTRKTATDK